MDARLTSGIIPINQFESDRVKILIDEIDCLTSQSESCGSVDSTPVNRCDQISITCHASPCQSPHMEILVGKMKKKSVRKLELHESDSLIPELKLETDDLSSPHNSTFSEELEPVPKLESEAPSEITPENSTDWSAEEIAVTPLRNLRKSTQAVHQSTVAFLHQCTLAPTSPHGTKGKGNKKKRVGRVSASKNTNTPSKRTHDSDDSSNPEDLRPTDHSLLQRMRNSTRLIRRASDSYIAQIDEPSRSTHQRHHKLRTQSPSSLVLCRKEGYIYPMDWEPKPSHHKSPHPSSSKHRSDKKQKTSHGSNVQVCQNWPESKVSYVSSNIIDDSAREIVDSLPVSDIGDKMFVGQILDKSHPCYGQRGTFAKFAIFEYDILGEYTGWLKSKRKNKVSKLNHYICRWVHVDGKVHLDIDASACGNETRFMNDFRGTAFTMPNAVMRSCIIDGVPRCFLIASRKIQKGEEILLDYGSDFWKAYENNHANGQHDESPSP